MKTKTKAFISVASALALSTGIVVSAQTISNGSSDSQSYNESQEEIVPEALVRCGEELTPFEEAILCGRAIDDPRGARSRGLITVEDYSDILAVNSTKSKLSLDLIFKRENDSSYTLWNGTFTVDDVSSFSNKFTDPENFSCYVSPDKSEMQANRGYTGNYKKVITRYTYLENGKKVTKLYSNEGNGNPLSKKSEYKSNGELVEVAAFFYIYSGTGRESLYYEVASVHVVDKDYSTTDMYAAEKYADRIGTYTYIDSATLEQASDAAVQITEDM